MDTNELETDLRAAVKLLPASATEKISDLLRYAFDHMEELKAIFPAIVVGLRRHVQTIAFEVMSGMADTNEIEAVLRKVFAEAGIKPPGV